MVKARQYLLLHFILFLYSLGSIFSKLGANEEMFSIKFIVLYGTVLFILFIFAILWQQVLKIMPLTTAYANKAVVIVWGMVWGKIIFNEKISINMILGSILIFYGIYKVVNDSEG